MAEAQAGRGWTPERSAAGERNPWMLTGVISLATFMVVLDTSIANVALPNIAGGLSASLQEATWVLTSFLVANAVVIPISGWLADVIGRKRYYMISVAIFTLASLMCALSPNLTFLIIARIIQGIGGGGLAPNEQSMLADSFPPEKRGMAFAAYAIVVVVGPVLGPTVGGYITDAISWHWIFLINVPMGAISLLLVQHFVVEPKIMIEERQARLERGVSVDYTGFALVALGLGCLTVMLERGQQEDWFASGLIVVMAAISLLALAALIFWELGRDDPIVRLELLGNRNFATVIGIMFLTGFILFGSTQIIPQMLQEIYRYTAFDAGLALTVGGLGIIAMMPLAGRLAGNVDARLMIIPGLCLLAFGLYYFTTLSLEASFGNLAFARFIQTLGLPAVFVPINTIAYFGLKPEQTNDASALLNVFRNLGGSVGISFAQTVLASNQQVHQSRLAETVNHLNPNLSAALANLQALSHDAQLQLAVIYQLLSRQARFLAYLDVYHAITLIIIASIPFCLLLRGSQAPGPRAA